MAETTEPVADFKAYLAETNLTPEEHQALPEEVRQYIWEAWQWEHQVIAPLSTDTEEVSETAVPDSAIVFDQESPFSNPVPQPSLISLPMIILGCALIFVTLTAIVLSFRS